MSTLERRPPDPIFTLKGNMKSIHCLAFDHGLLYAGAEGGMIHVWDLKDNRQVYQQKIGENTCITMIRIDKTILTQEKGGIYKIWKENPRELILEKEFLVEYYGFCASDMINDENLCVVCPDSNSGFSIYSLKTESVKNVRNDGTDGEIMAMKVYKGFIYVIYERGIVKIWNLQDTELVTSLLLTKDCPMTIDVREKVSKDCIISGVIGTSGLNITEFNFETNKRTLIKGRELELTNEGVSSIAIRPDNKLFAAGCWDFRIRLYSFKSWKLLAVLESHTNVVQRISFFSPSETGKKYLIASAGLDGRISLWDIYN